MHVPPPPPSHTQLEEMENERIEELGTSLSAKPSQDVHIGGSVRHSSTSKSRGQSMADLQVSSSLGKLASSSLTDLREQSYEGESQKYNPKMSLLGARHTNVIVLMDRIYCV